MLSEMTSYYDIDDILAEEEVNILSFYLIKFNQLAKSILSLCLDSLSQLCSKKLLMELELIPVLKQIL